jgi:hypothetical protein
MNAKDLIKHHAEFSWMLVRSYADDFTDAELLVRAVPQANHVAWQLGHMIAGTAHMLAMLGQPAPKLPDGFAEAHGREANRSDDPKQFASKAEYFALAEQMKAATLAAVDATPDGDLDNPGPEAMRAYAPTVGAALSVLASHPMMHAGQFVTVRRKLGKPILF